MRTLTILSIAIITLLAILLITQFAFKPDKQKEKQTMNIKSVFANNKRIPEKYTCDGEDISPPIELIDIPKNAESLVLIVDDPDAPKETWDHWILFNISPQIKKIEENSIPRGAVQGKNSWNNSNYAGPCPPSGTHRYFFKLYALNTILDLDENAAKADVENAMEGHVINVAELIGLYSRR